MNVFKHVNLRLNLVKKVNKLPFTDAGIDSDGDVWVEYDGYRFHGESSYPKDKKYYNVLSAKVKKRLPFECFRLAMDIIIRYVEGGLKYGGPFKHDHYQLKRGETAAEMGAYMGHHIMKLCRLVGDQGTVVAIEPLPDNLYYLNKNVSYNRLKQVNVVPKGVWKEPTTINFNRKASDHQSGSIVIGERNEDQSLPVDTLNNIFEDLQIDACDLMIVQLNGVEPIAVEGLTSFEPKNFAIAARYDYDGIDAVKSLTEILKSRDYQTWIEEERFVYAQKK